MEIIIGEKRYLEQEPKCPVCRHILSGATHAGTGDDKDASPDPGDYSVCIYCATVLRFGMGLKQFTVATRDDLKELQEKQPETFRLMEEMIKAATRRMRERQRKRYRRN